MEFTIETLTPLWTGGVKAGKMDRIHETGIIGSLRWWYEAIVRGLGGLVNDPTKDEGSGFDSEKYKKSKASDVHARLREAGLCEVSQVFGATGWRRRFRLSIVDHTHQDTSSPKQISVEHTNTETSKKATWWFKDYPRTGNLTIQIQSLAEDFPAEAIAGLFQFLADWAAIGGKTQMGFGVIKPVSGRICTQSLYDWLIHTVGNHHYPQLPSLQNIFLACIQLTNAKDQDTFKLKYDLRQLFAGQQSLRHFIMGTTQGGRMAAKIKMSRPYGDGLIRVWGWIPQKVNVYQSQWDRNKVVDTFYQHINTNYTLLVWREMNSPRDTDTPNNSDAREFLRTLLKL
jgi:CRISPR-associated protein Cmr1